MVFVLAWIRTCWFFCRSGLWSRPGPPRGCGSQAELAPTGLVFVLAWIRACWFFCRSGLWSRSKPSARLRVASRACFYRGLCSSWRGLERAGSSVGAASGRDRGLRVVAGRKQSLLLQGMAFVLAWIGACWFFCRSGLWSRPGLPRGCGSQAELAPTRMVFVLAWIRRCWSPRRLPVPSPRSPCRCVRCVRG